MIGMQRRHSAYCSMSACSVVCGSSRLCPVSGSRGRIRSRSSLRIQGASMDNGTEYVYFHDFETGMRFGFNVTFMLSHYNCTYGRGCEGVGGVPEIGCCPHGVTLSTDLDYTRTLKWAERAAKMG